jgi:hypoxanthine phosphoribosyltransferase
MKTLLSEAEIRGRVDEMAAAVARDYEGRPLTVLGVLTGSLMFLTDLVRRIDLPLRIGLIQASSYRGRTTTAGQLTIDTGLVPDVRGRDVLLLDDILDTGRTLERLAAAVERFEPTRLRTAVLLWKTARTEVDLTPDYCGFQIPDEFVVGYGLDYNDHYRHLPYIAVLEEGDL